MAKKRKRKAKKKKHQKAKRAHRNVEDVDFVYRENGSKAPTQEAIKRHWDNNHTDCSIYEDEDGRMRQEERQPLQKEKNAGNSPAIK